MDGAWRAWAQCGIACLGWVLGVGKGCGFIGKTWGDNLLFSCNVLFRVDGIGDWGF